MNHDRPIQGSPLRTVADLEHAVRALTFHFKTDAVVIVGSQSVLVGWPDAPDIMRTSPEIDAYPANIRQWEESRPGELASEEVNGSFGEGTQFQEQFHFFIDGVGPKTASLPPLWQERAVFLSVRDAVANVTVTAVAPCTDDMIVSKLQRLVEKDKGYIESCHKARPLHIDVLKDRLAECTPPQAVTKAAHRFLDDLPKRRPQPKPAADVKVPPYNRDTHCAFLAADGRSVTIREWDEDKQLYYKVGNDLGPAVVSQYGERYFIGGSFMKKEDWERHPDVRSVRSASKPDVAVQTPATRPRAG